MKTAIIALTLITLFLFLTGCKVDLVGDSFSQIYPKDGYAKTLTVTSEDPIETTEPVNVPLDSLVGYVCVSEKQFAEYRRAYEQEHNNKVLDVVNNKLEASRWQDLLIKNQQ